VRRVLRVAKDRRAAVSAPLRLAAEHLDRSESLGARVDQDPVDVRQLEAEIAQADASAPADPGPRVVEASLRRRARVRAQAPDGVVAEQDEPVLGARPASRS
jgi:hypothetical protein